MLASEAVMGALAKRAGKQTAHQIVYEASMAAVENGVPLRQALLDSPARDYLSDADLDALFDLRNSLGHALDCIDHVLALGERDRGGRSPA